MTKFDPNPYAATATEQPNADLKSAFLSIWFRPRDTIRSIVAKDASKHVVLLGCLSGITGMLSEMESQNAGDSIPLIWILLIAGLAGPISGLVQIWLIAYLLELTGRGLNGKAERSHLRAALAWSDMPQVARLFVFWIPLLLAFGIAKFTTAGVAPVDPIHASLHLALLGIRLILGIWRFVLTLKTVAEVQGFRSSWTALWNMIRALLVLMVVVMPIAVIVVLVRYL